MKLRQLLQLQSQGTNAQVPQGRGAGRSAPRGGNPRGQLRVLSQLFHPAQETSAWGEPRETRTAPCLTSKTPQKHPKSSALTTEGTPGWDLTSVGVAHAGRDGRLLLLPLHRHHHLLLDPLLPSALRFQLVVRGQCQRGAGLVLEALIGQGCLQWRVEHGCGQGAGGEGAALLLGTHDTRRERTRLLLGLIS